MLNENLIGSTENTAAVSNRFRHIVFIPASVYRNGFARRRTAKHMEINFFHIFNFLNVYMQNLVLRQNLSYHYNKPIYVCVYHSFINIIIIRVYYFK